MEPSTKEGKGPRLRRLPPRPRDEPRLAKCAIAVTVQEKRKVDVMATMYGVDASVVLYFKPVSVLVREYNRIYDNENAQRVG